MFYGLATLSFLEIPFESSYLLLVDRTSLKGRGKYIIHSKWFIEKERLTSYQRH